MSDFTYWGLFKLLIVRRKGTFELKVPIEVYCKEFDDAIGVGLNHRKIKDNVYELTLKVI